MVINNTTATINNTHHAAILNNKTIECTINEPATITYPSTGKFTIKQSGASTKSPANCDGAPSPSAFDPNKNPQSTINYSLSGNTLTLSEEGKNMCKDYGSSGPIQLIFVKQ